MSSFEMLEKFAKNCYKLLKAKGTFGGMTLNPYFTWDKKFQWKKYGNVKVMPDENKTEIKSGDYTIWNLKCENSDEVFVDKDYFWNIEDIEKAFKNVGF